jgi:hypothetical protein
MASTISAGTTSGTAIAIAGDTTGALALQTNNGTTAVTVDTSQNVGVGTTSPSSKLHVVGTSLTNSFRVTDASNYTICMGYAGSGNTGLISTLGGTAVLGLGTNSTERMRIDGNGYAYINSTNLYNNCRLSVAFDGSTGNAIGCQNTDTGSATQNAIFFYRNGTQVATISYSNTTVFYNTSSDYRLKQNITPMTGALAKVTQLKPVTYNWKVDGSSGQGFIAHELKAVVPECVTGEKDEVDAEGNPVHQGVDTSFLVATLTAAIQELNAKVDAQAATIAELQARTT